MHIHPAAPNFSLCPYIDTDRPEPDGPIYACVICKQGKWPLPEKSIVVVCYKLPLSAAMLNEVGLDFAAWIRPSKKLTTKVKEHIASILYL